MYCRVERPTAHPRLECRRTPGALPSPPSSLPLLRRCREAALGRVVRKRGVLLTTYGMVLHNAELLGGHEGHDPDDGPMWDIMICGG